MASAVEPVLALKDGAEQAYRMGRYTEAAGMFQQAARESSASGDARMAAELESNRSVALLQAGDPPGALASASGAVAVFRRSGDSHRLALALGNQAAALEALRRRKEALACYHESRDLLRQAGDNAHRVHVHKRISALQLRSGHPLDALTTMHAALLLEKHPTLVERLLNALLNQLFKLLGRGS